MFGDSHARNHAGKRGYDSRGRMVDENGRPYKLGRPFHGLPTRIYLDDPDYIRGQRAKWSAICGLLFVAAPVIGRAIGLI